MVLWEMVAGTLRPVSEGASIRVARPDGPSLVGRPGAVVGRLGTDADARILLAASGYYLEHLSGPDLGAGYGPPRLADEADGLIAAVRDPLPGPAPRTLAQAQAEALEAIGQAREGRLVGGWWCYLDLGQGAQWYRYAGEVPEDRALIAGAVLIAQARVATGQPDASPYRCASQTELSGESPWPPVLRLHSAAQLAAVLAAGGYLLAALGQMYDVARATIEAAESPAECDQVAADTHAAMAACCIPPALEVPA